MRDDTFPPVIFFLLITNALAYVLTEFSPQFARFALIHLALYSELDYLRVWQPVSYSFLHGGVAHLGLNMFALWMFGRTMELTWGSRRFLTYYFVCVLGAAAAQIILAYISGTPSRTIGASGGVFGILLAFGMTYPNQRILLLFPPIPMPAKYFVVLYGIIELYFGLTQPGSTTAHFAHLGGMVVGLVLILIWRAQRRIR